MRIVIAGAGVAGLTAAFWLERHGHDCTVVELAPDLRADGYMLDFFGPGLHVAERMGLGADLEALHVPVARLATLGPDGHEQYAIPYATLRRRLFEDRHFNFMRGGLVRLLYRLVRDRVRCRFGTGLAAIETGDRETRVAFSDGTRATVDLVIGADGVHSRVRDLVFGAPGRFVRPLGMAAVAGILDGVPPGLDAHAFSTLTVPDRQVVAYPVGDGRFATLFLWRPPADGRGTAAPDCRAAFGAMRGIVPALLDSVDGPDAFAGELEQVVMPEWHRDGVVLLGDACGCVSLPAGQGASLAMTGALVLAQSLAFSPILVRALAEYERRMRPLVDRVQAAGRRTAGWLLPHAGWQIRVRDLLFRAGATSAGAPLLRRTLVTADAAPEVAASGA